MLFDQYSQLLGWYNDLNLALSLNSGMQGDHQIQFFRDFIHKRMTDENRRWLAPYLHEELKFKTKGFVSNLMRDYVRLQRIAALNAALAERDDEYRLQSTFERFGKILAVAYNENEKVRFSGEQAKRFEKNGFILASEKDVDALIKSESLSSDNPMVLTYIVRKPSAYYLIKEGLAEFGWYYSLPKYKKNQFDKVALWVEHKSEAMVRMKALGEPLKPEL